MSKKSLPWNSVHHILAKSHEWNNSNINLIELKDKTHRSIHQLFWNENLWEKIKVMMWIERTALREEVKIKLSQCLSSIGSDDVDWYKIECFKSKE